MGVLGFTRTTTAELTGRALRFALKLVSVLFTLRSIYGEVEVKRECLVFRGFVHCQHFPRMKPHHPSKSTIFTLLLTPLVSVSIMMSGWLRGMKNMLPASRRAAKELAELQLAKEIEQAYQTKVMMWGAALGGVSIAVFLGVFFWQRARSSRQATESAGKESALVRKMARDIRHARTQCEVR